MRDYLLYRLPETAWRFSVQTARYRRLGPSCDLLTVPRLVGAGAFCIEKFPGPVHVEPGRFYQNREGGFDQIWDFSPVTAVGADDLGGPLLPEPDRQRNCVPGRHALHIITAHSNKPLRPCHFPGKPGVFTVRRRKRTAACRTICLVPRGHND